MPAISPARRIGLRLVGALVLLGLGVAATAPRLAVAAFLAHGEGVAAAQAHTVSQGSVPGIAASGRDVTATWDPATVGDAAVDGYTIRRYTQGAQTGITLPPGCLTAPTTCADRALPPGTWEYTVTPISGQWAGQESTRSASMTVAPPSIMRTSPSSVTALPATVTADIAGHVGGAALSYRLGDPSSGPPLDGTPASVPAGGAASVSVVLTPDVPVGTHRIYVVADYASAGGGATDVSWVEVAVHMQTEPFTPRSLSLSNVPGGTAGRIDAGDVVTVDFSQPLSVSGVCGLWSGDDVTQIHRTGVTVTVTRDGAGTGRDRLDVASAGCADGLGFGSIDLGANYLQNVPSLTWGTASGPSELRYDPAARALTVVLGARAGGSVNQLLVVPSSTATFTPDARLRSSQGQAVSGTVSKSGTLF